MRKCARPGSAPGEEVPPGEEVSPGEEVLQVRNCLLVRNCLQVRKYTSSESHSICGGGKRPQR